MAAGSWIAYQAAKLALTKGQIDLSSTTNIFCVLVGSGYAPAVNAHSTYADISANEATGTAYTAGGTVLPTVTDSVITAGTITFNSGVVSWSVSTITAKYAVLVYRTSAGTPNATDKLIGYCDLNSGGGSVSTTAGTFQISMNVNGIFTLT